MFTRPEAYNVQVTTEFTQPQQGSFSLKMKGSATVNTMFSKILGQATINLVGDVRGDLGHQEAQSGAGSRQHRLDGVERRR